MDEAPKHSENVRVATMAIGASIAIYGVTCFTDGRITPEDIFFIVPVMIVAVAGALGAAYDDTMRWLKFGVLLGVGYFVWFGLIVFNPGGQH